MSETGLAARIAGSVGSIDAAAWNALAGDNPFVSHEFLSALEDSGSVGPGTGWQPVPIVISTDDGPPLAAMPAYAKGHSQGEYVFDHAWADAYLRAGGNYYPKLQIAVPFTPATGPRLLLSDPALATPLLSAAEQLCLQNDFSSAHATFIEPEQREMFEQAGWLPRSDIQFHWLNRDFATFEDFLATLTSRKRKDLRKERTAAKEGLEIVRLTGSEIRPEHWDAFWHFYQDTGARKWGQPYLTRAAFDLFGERMGDRIVLVLAMEDGVPIAGALNFVGGDALYGRYWGCTKHVRFLHFELCYYQAIDIAIERGLARVEAGAQGGHKLARGYEPVETISAHWFADPGFRAAVAEFLEREREGVAADRNYLERRTPFRKGN
ncbi:GNAT family N-acetyltransferase [Qipengyuania sp. 1NDW9]|uniref:GNAT family N-acetyltransferase n=1 Tax=Qipengyuania xiapuensis TaxID=2867236 RepID=UPI001C878667|nr:GNAT family N-acetyltransferase [Qipengyuania xiapuensis]